jgi:hypothetical protein
MSQWLIWGVLLILQNAAHTATSRARNSKGAVGLWYNGIASIFSNGVWFASQFFIVNMLITVKDKPTQFAAVLTFYIILTAFGSVGSQWIMQKWEAKHGIEHG